MKTIFLLAIWLATAAATVHTYGYTEPAVRIQRIPNLVPSGPEQINERAVINDGSSINGGGSINTGGLSFGGGLNNGVTFSNGGGITNGRGSLNGGLSYGGALNNGGGSIKGYSSVIPTTKYNHVIKGADYNSVEFETGNGISLADTTLIIPDEGNYMNEYGQMVPSGATVTKNGYFSYTSPEGQKIYTGWSADQNGFSATGSHLPISPPIPADIAASLGLNYGGGVQGTFAAPQQSSYSSPRTSSYSAGVQIPYSPVIFPGY